MNLNLSKDERLWGMLCHLSALAFFFIPFGHIVGPLVIWLIKKEEMPFVMEQGRESLNFQITITIYSICAGILIVVLIGIPLLVAIFLFDFVMVIIASVKANEGISYSYPLNIRVIK
ncbi:MAG: DUF4870 domain-containing protein [Ignavibacteria bacterium]|jgi:uncharacterized Tic20 family protein